MVKQDGRCGSTVGPKLSTSLAMRTADIGLPQLAMHSCRETMGTAAVDQLRRFSKTFFEQLSAIDDNTIVDG